MLWLANLSANGIMGNAAQEGATGAATRRSTPWPKASHIAPSADPCLSWQLSERVQRVASPPPVAQTAFVKPARVVLLPARVANPNPSAAAFVDAVRQAVLRKLRAYRTLELIDVSDYELASVAPRNPGPLREDRVVYLAVSRHFDADVVAEILEDSPADFPLWLVEVTVAKGDRLGSRDESSPKAGQGSGADAESIAVALALAVAAAFGSRSATPATRHYVWSTLRRQVYDRALAQPLSVALLSDPDETVRREAALALGAYTGESGVSAALAHARRVLERLLADEPALAARAGIADVLARQPNGGRPPR